jgi:hypothetical protein
MRSSEVLQQFVSRERAWLRVAVAAMLLGAANLVVGAIFATWLFSGLSTSGIHVPWNLITPLLVQAGIIVLVALALLWRWRVAFLAAVALEFLALARWVALVAAGDPFVFEWPAVLATVFAIVALSGLALSWRLFWPTTSAEAEAG